MTSQLPDAIRQQLADLARELDDHSHGTIACEVLRTLVAISQSNADSGDWELINGTLADMAEALDVFQPHRQIRKVAIFGSARTPEDDPVYALTVDVCLLYTSPSPRDLSTSRMPSSA